MSTTRSQRRRPTAAAEREQRDQERRDCLEAIHSQLTEQVEALMNSADWQKMLAAAARFHKYSWRNVLLILRQRPDATRVAARRARHRHPGTVTYALGRFWRWCASARSSPPSLVPVPMADVASSQCSRSLLGIETVRFKIISPGA